MAKLLNQIIIIILILLSLISGYRPISFGQKDLISAYSAITVDGFDFIIVGRALAQGFEGEVVSLRNPAFTLISYLDAITGKIGFIFGATISLSLLLQIYSLIKIMKFFKLNLLLQNLILLSFFLHWIHFINLYILSDLFSLSIMLLGIYFLLTGINENSLTLKEFIGSTLISISALGQFYTLFGFGILLLKILNNNIQRFIRLKILSIVAINILILIMIRLLWNYTVPHKSVPLNFELLKINLNMINFYLNTWTVMFLPIIVSIILIIIPKFKVNFKDRVYNVNKEFIFLFSYVAVIAAITLFYQWAESRFSYLLFIFTFILIIYIVKSNEKIWIDFLYSCTILTIIFSVLWSPINKWQPRVGESVFFRPWIVERYWEAIPFKYYVELRESYCNITNVIEKEKRWEEINNSDILRLVEPVRETALFGIKNCL